MTKRMKQRAQVTCGCGCGKSDYVNRLRTIELEGAMDESLRKTFIVKRFMVTPQCYAPMLEELTAMRLLNEHLLRYKNASWFMRLIKMRQVVRLQWLIHERNKGEKATRRISIRGAMMFAGGPRVAGWLDLFFRWKDQRKLPKPCSPTPTS